MTILLIYVLLFIFWIEATFNSYVSPIKGLSLSNMLLYFLICWYGISVAFKRRRFIFNKLDLYFLALVVIIAFSIPLKIMNGEFKHVSLVREIVSFKGWVEPIFVFVLIFNLIGDKETCKKIISGLSVVLMLTVIITLLVVTNIALIGGLDFEHGGYWPKFAEPNQYAAYLVLMIPLFFSAVVFKKGFFTKTFALLCVVFSISSLICTGSRGGLLSFFISSVIYGIFLLKMKKIDVRSFLVSFILICLIIIGSFVFLPERIIDRTVARIMFSQDERELTLDTYSSGRIQLWGNALKLFTDRPFLGYGQDGFHSLFEERYNLKLDPHNMYIKYLLDHGIIGFLVFIMIMTHLARSTLSQFRRTNDPYGEMLYLSFFCGFLGYALAIFFVDLYNIRFLVFIYAAVVYRFIDLDREEAESQVQNEITPVRKQNRVSLA